MVHWLVQSTRDIPEAVRGFPPPGVLTDQENIQLAGFRPLKRRQEWLLGRWTSKLLVQEMVRSQSGEALALNEVGIANATSGAPYATCELRYNRIPVSISISHSGDRAFCAAVGICSPANIPAGMIGADIEQVEKRPAGFVEQYFTDTEIALISRTPARSRDLLVTATWSAKEAALKALRLGLTVDARTATCWIEAATDAPEDWTSFRIDWDVRRLNRFALPGSELPNLAGWWRIMDGYVLTLAAGDHTPPQELILPSGEGS